MNINLSLLGQMVTFGIFVWFTMKFVWPPIMQALTERQDNIADGLAAAEQGRLSLEEAIVKNKETISQAKLEGHRLVEDAKRRSALIVDDAKARAREEGDRIVAQAKTEIDQERETAKQSLYREISVLSVLGAEKLLGREIDGKGNDDLFKALIKDIEVGKSSWRH